MMRKKSGARLDDYLRVAEEGHYEWIFLCENGKEQRLRVEEIRREEN